MTSFNNNIDEDDEFGGATNSVAKIFRNRKTSLPPALDSDDDEFGGATNSIDKIFRKREITTTSTTSKKYVKPKVVNTDYTPINCEYKIFSPPIRNNQWHINRENLTNQVKDTKDSLTIPIVVDTEFTDQNRKKYKQQKRFGLTTQIKGVGVDAPKQIYAHTPLVNSGRDLMGLKPYPMVNSDFHPIDYLRDCGLEVDLRQGYDDELKTLPKCYVTVYGHFLTAELNMICNGTVKERIKQLQRTKGDEEINSGRRAFCQTTIDGIKLD